MAAAGTAGSDWSEGSEPVIWHPLQASTCRRSKTYRHSVGFAAGAKWTVHRATPLTLGWLEQEQNRPFG